MGDAVRIVDIRWPPTCRYQLNIKLSRLNLRVKLAFF